MKRLRVHPLPPERRWLQWAGERFGYVTDLLQIGTRVGAAIAGVAAGDGVGGGDITDTGGWVPSLRQRVRRVKRGRRLIFDAVLHDPDGIKDVTVYVSGESAIVRERLTEGGGRPRTLGSIEAEDPVIHTRPPAHSEAYIQLILEGKQSTLVSARINIALLGIVKRWPPPKESTHD